MVRERTIINSISKDIISPSEASILLKQEGIILMFENDKVVGFVYKNNDYWIGETPYKKQECVSLEELMSNFPKYIFKYITE